MALVILCNPQQMLGAGSRPVIHLDGDPAVRTLDSEDLLLTRVSPSSPTTEFGSAVAFGDVNGDGLADALVGQRTENRVFIYLGSTDPKGSAYFGDPNAADITISAPTGALDAIQQFGFSVGVTDLNGDGIDDLLAGAPFSDPGGTSDAGRAFAILDLDSLPGGGLFSLDAPPAGVSVLTFTRGGLTAAGDLLGFAVGGGNLTGLADSYLVVTARDARGPAPSNNEGAGAAHVVRGSTLPAGTATFDLGLGSAVTLYGADASDAFGEVVATCDVDGGGDSDLIVGAIFGDGPVDGGLNRGETLLFLGENIASGYYSGTITAAAANLAVHGGANGDDLGYSVACGDLDGDGWDDIVTGALFADAATATPGPRPSSGEVHVLKGRASQVDPNTPARRELVDPATSLPQAPIDLDPNGPSVGSADLTLLGATTADQLGFSAGVGDVNGDGIRDLVVGARRYDRDQPLPNTGATYVLLGSPGFLAGPRTIDLLEGTNRTVVAGFDPNSPIDELPDQVDSIIIGASKDDHSAFGVALGDLNGDGSEEVMVGAIGDLAREPGFPGEAYILSFADIDGDGATDLVDIDSDNDGVPDLDESAGTFTGGSPTNPFHPDSDGDGIQDGTELGFTCPGGGGTVEVACDDPNIPFTSTDPSLQCSFDPNLDCFFRRDGDPSTQTNPLDADSDDDGLPDGTEDADLDGGRDATETDASDHDTDADLVFDGTESGVTMPLPNTDLTAGHFVADADGGLVKTDPLDPDTDGDGLEDGAEDADGNGAILGDVGGDNDPVPNEVWGETDPNDPDTDRDGVGDGPETGNPAVSPLDQDSDDDGVIDGDEDTNGSGTVEPFESDPGNPDSDGDGLTDGQETGVTGGILGRNGAPDAGPGEDGTDTTSPNFRIDADAGRSTTDPILVDSDADGIPDGVEDANLDGAVAGDTNLNHVWDPNEIWSETDPSDPDTDRDGVQDGIEDDDLDGNVDPGETDPLDQDTDDDGLPDGWIDGANGGMVDGFFEAREGENRDGDPDTGPSDGESDPLLADSDGDGLPDGLEAGVQAGGGVPGRNGTPDAGPGEDGTDPTSPNLVPDGDPNTTTEPWDADTDDDGLPDGFRDGHNPNSAGQPGGVLDGIASVHEGEDFDRDGVVDPGETDPNFRDSDTDGVRDGVERGVLATEKVLGLDMQADPTDGSGVQDGTGGPALEFDADDATLTDPLDADTEDDGLSDGAEDANSSGLVDPDEPDPDSPDSDMDGLNDGLEGGRTLSNILPDTDVAAGNFVEDQDPNTTTNPARADTDGGGAPDGEEDVDLNGRVDAGERDPNDPGDDDRTGILEFTDTLDGTMTVTSILVGDTIFLRLNDDEDENLDPNIAEQVAVACAGSAPMDMEPVTLTATGDDSAIFVGSLSTTAGLTAPGDGNLTVAAGGAVTCTYTDDEDPVDERTAMVDVNSPAPGSDIEVSLSAGGLITWGPAGGGEGAPGTVFNLYRGELWVLIQSGVYTQTVVACGLAETSHDDGESPVPGAGLFYLLTATAGGVEGGLGADSLGNPRPFSQQCAP